MPMLQIELTDQELEQLGEYARAANRPAAAVAQAQLRHWLAQHKGRFREALQSVVSENAELYRRLA